MYRDRFLAMPEDVIAFAWSAPMRELAAKVGISDVGLKKLLRSFGFEPPPQGYWNKVLAGRPVPSLPRPPERRPGERGRIRLDVRFRGHVPVATAMSEEGPFTSQLVPESLADLYARELAAIGRVSAPRDLSRPGVGLARLLRQEEARRAKQAASGYSWGGPHHSSPVAQRQLRILSALSIALERRRNSCEAWEQNFELQATCTIGDQQLGLRFTVAGKHRTDLRSGYNRPADSLPANTPLRLLIERKFRAPIVCEWSDEPDRPLEKQLAEIAAALVVAGEASFRQALVEDREHEESYRRWQEEARLKRLDELREKRLADLKTSGELLRQAEEIRRLVSLVEEAIRSGEAQNFSAPQLARWKAWALTEADAIDPVKSGQVLSHFHVSALDEGQDKTQRE